MTAPYIYRIGDLHLMVDGDTFAVVLHSKPDEKWAPRIRLAGFDTPELRSPSRHERAKGLEAAGFTQAFLRSPGPLWCRLTGRQDSFGRHLGVVWSEVDGIATDLGELLADNQLASRWPTRWRDQYPEAS